MKEENKSNFSVVTTRVDVIHFESSSSRKAKKRKNSISAGLKKNYFCFFFIEYVIHQEQTLNLLNFYCNKLQINRFFGIVFICNEILAYAYWNIAIHFWWKWIAINCFEILKIPSKNADMVCAQLCKNFDHWSVLVQCQHCVVLCKAQVYL